MKSSVKTSNIYKNAFLFFVIAALLVVPGCSKNDSINPLSQRLQELTGTWSVNQVTNDSEDVTALYSGFTLTLNADKSFSVTNGGNSWPASGTFDFKENYIDLVLRSDDVDVLIDDISTSSLVLSFTIQNLSGRVSGITGQFTFSLSR